MFVLTGLAQNAEEQYRKIYDTAERDYKIGRIEQAESLLKQNLRGFPMTLRQSAYRLLSMCCLSTDRINEAQSYVKMLLDENPYYSTTLSDPQRFIDMVDDLKSGMTATITTASSKAENLNEVPVPTTLITEEMIRNSGARNLQEVLATYVPGMNIVDCNDDINIAMRGLYSNGQEKILIMLNGHRLNSYSTNVASPDFSIGLEKLKQIEVLRGPASSLYGGVALTAVVNLITKQGADVDGIQGNAGVGNHGQFKGDIIMGKRYFDLDILLWGNMYKTSGETKDIPGDRNIYNGHSKSVTIAHIGSKPSYEFGLNMKWKDLQFQYDTQFSQVVSPYTISTLGTSYQYDDYRTFNGYYPSFVTQSHHADISYNFNYKKLFLKGTLTYDNNDMTHYQVISEIPIPGISQLNYFPKDVGKILENYGGTYRYINGREKTYGATVKGDFSYVDNQIHKGTLSFGAEYSHFQLDDMRYVIGYEYKNNLPEMTQIYENAKGHENSYNAFVQLKHQWKSLIFNAGMRYDHKNRYDGSKVNEFSPRLALILLQPKWNVKLSYSKSFVDAPYFYRKTNDMQQLWNPSAVITKLSPESLHSIQLTFAGVEWFKGFNFEINGFYNSAKDLLTTMIIEHMNMGTNKTFGIEVMADYHKRRFSANFNFSWINTFKSNVAYEDIDNNNSIPKLTSNLVLGWQATSRLKLHSRILFEGPQKAYSANMTTMLQLTNMLAQLEALDEPMSDSDFELYMQLSENFVKKHKVNGRVIFNLGAEYQLIKNVSLGLDIHNLFNTNYNQSGMNTVLVPQRGRWFMASIGIKL
jgi:iron complex outermembrane receptor protein